jgi:hypothetical protein
VSGRDGKQLCAHDLCKCSGLVVPLTYYPDDRTKEKTKLAEHAEIVGEEKCI